MTSACQSPTLASQGWGTRAIKIKVDGSTIECWVGGTLEVSATDYDIAAGGVALAGEKAKFDDVMVGYDVNDDNDINDSGTDNLVMNEAFGSTDEAVSHCNAGNLIYDGSLVYIYDAWNRLVKVRSAEDADVVIHEAEFDGLGKRIKKVGNTSAKCNDRERQSLKRPVNTVKTNTLT